jgi:hypothetical protein
MFKPILKMLKSLLIIMATFFCNKVNAQDYIKLSKLKYDSVINEIELLNKQNLNQPLELIEVKLLPNGWNEIIIIGFQILNSKDELTIIEVSGNQITLLKKNIEKIKKINIDINIVGILKEYAFQHPIRFKGINIFEGFEIIPYYLTALWLHINNNSELAVKVLSKLNKESISSKAIQSIFGNKYYNEMLIAYCNERDYKKAMFYGEYFVDDNFNNFQYKLEALSLTNQLRLRMSDFKTFTIPDSIKWIYIKNKLKREEQLNYLIERLHLINCIQPGQPANINYSMIQNAISYDSMQPDTTSLDFWNSMNKYKVINPFMEIISMNPTISDVKYFLPHLLDSSFIPTFTYWRDFSSQRTLYRFNWLIESLIFHITNQKFINLESFNNLTVSEKTLEINKIKDWCLKNKDLTHEELLLSIMSETKDWNVFERAMDICKEKKYKSVLEVLEKRFKDFSTDGWPSQKGLIVKTVFEMGSETSIKSMRIWNNQAEDEWIKLWSSLFLLKYDSLNYNKVFETLKNLLKECDGTAYYPYAMETLLNLKNKPALALAEGIIYKENFRRMFYWEYYQNFIYMLLLSKSEVAYKFLHNGLLDFKNDDGVMGFNKDGNKLTVLNCDNYIRILENWTPEGEKYNVEWNIERRKKFSTNLDIWLTNQFNLIVSNQKFEIINKLNNVSEPTQFVDSPKN